MSISKMLAALLKPRPGLIVIAFFESSHDMCQAPDSAFLGDFTCLESFEHVPKESVHVVVVAIAEFSFAGHAFSFFSNQEP